MLVLTLYDLLEVSDFPSLETCLKLEELWKYLILLQHELFYFLFVLRDLKDYVQKILEHLVFLTALQLF